MYIMFMNGRTQIYLKQFLRGSFNMPVRKHMQGYSLKHWL